MVMLDKLNLIGAKAKQDKDVKFTSLIHLVNEENLAQCYRELKRDRACGIDGVSVEEYGLHLEENLRKLVNSLKTKSYKPQPVRRVYIPKPGKSEKRPLGIPCVEDKLIQLAVKKILESICEADFVDESFGFRPNRGCLDAVNRLHEVVRTEPINFIVEVDIRKFFDNVSHYWLLRCLEERIKDPNFLWLVRKLLKAGVVDNGAIERSLIGTPQGGIASPILANIYLHFVLDLWFTRVIKPRACGQMHLIRYCDDFIVCCRHSYDAEKFMVLLKKRLAKFSLSVAEEKTRIVKFGRSPWQKGRRNGVKPGTFNFLGFTHYCGTSRNGYFVVGHKTSKEVLRRTLKGARDWLKLVSSTATIKEWWPLLKAKLSGHYAYFGISGNFRDLKLFYFKVIRLVFKWINRRSQRKSMNWERFLQYLNWYPLPKPRIIHTLGQSSPKRFNAMLKSPVREIRTPGSVGGA